MHDPSRATERHEARARGGRARHGRQLTASGDQVRLVSLADVVGLVEREVNNLLTLELSVGRARAVGYLAGVAVKALQVSELEARILALETKLGV